MRSSHRGLRLSLLLSSIVAAAAVTQATFVTDAWADSAEKKKVAVGAFEGPKSGDARSAFIESLKKDGNYEVTDAEDVSASAKDKAIVDAAKGLGVSFIITGKVQKTTLKLKVRSGKDGKVLDDASITGNSQAKLQENVASTGAASVAGAMGVKAAAPEKPKEEAKPAEEEKPKEEEKEEEEEKPAEEAPADSGGDKGLTPLEVEAGISAVHRTFDFHDTIAELQPNQGYSPMLSYELPLGPAVLIRASVYPISFVSKGAGEWFGVTAGFEKGFAISSVYQENVMGSELTLKTNMQHFYVGPRFRFPIGEHILGLTGTYGQHKFVLVGDENLSFPLIPDITYSYVKVGLDGTFRFGDILAGARIGKRFVFDTGAMEDVWFKNAKATSLEAGVDVGYRLSSMLDLVASFDWLRYAFDFNPVEPRPPAYASYVAGGAVDQYLTGSVSVRFHMDPSAE